MRREPPPKGSIWAAGSVVARRRDNGKPEYLLIHRPRYKDWTLPKGKLDDGETFVDGAVRETREETGFEPVNPRLIGTIAYETTNGNPKVVRWWLGEASDGGFTPNEEVDKIKWVTFRKGRERLTYRNDREVLDRAHDMYRERSSGVIYLVRHGWAGHRGNGADTDWQRPLDTRGTMQRRALRQLLQAHPLTRIGSSNFTRCVQTVKPLSKRMGIPIEFEPALVEGSHPERMIALIGELQGEAAVLCTHGDVIADLIGGLFADGVPMDGEMTWKKGSIWELRTVAGRVVSGRYVPPPA
jgi:8-oxo-dGTP pyrophosphatase MutT (NUDIX family)